MNDAIRMQISAFVDGELPDNEAELLLRRMCQDDELREQAAEYLAMGRAMRGHSSVPGAERLRERITAALDDTSLQAEFDAIQPTTRRYLRPVVGGAIAATVALAAIIGLQQVGGFNEVDVAPIADTAESTNPGYTVPEVTVPEVHRGLHELEKGDLDALRATFEQRAEEIETPADDADDEAAPSDPAQDDQTP